MGTGKYESIGEPAWNTHERLQRIALLSDNQLTENTLLKNYSAVLVDEAHLLSAEKLQILLKQAEGHFPIIFSSDSEDAICPDELGENISVYELLLALLQPDTGKT